jgi:hypothetical protein
MARAFFLHIPPPPHHKRGTDMSIKKLSLTLAAVLALACIAAASAFATATASKGHWVVSGAKLSGSKTVTCAKATGSGNFKMVWKVLGTPAEFEASGLECLESTISSPGEFAVGSGKLRFTGVTITNPVGCRTTSTISTGAISSQTYMEGTKVYVRFVPTSGTTFVNVPISGCAAAGSYPIKGSEFGLSPNLTGVESEHQKLEFSGAINTTAGGALSLGTDSATLAGVAENTLSPSVPFAATE